MEKSHAAVSRQIEALSQRLDAFFGGEREYQEGTGSYVRLGGYVTVEEGPHVRPAQDIRVRLVLPYTQKRFRLILTNAPEADLGDRLDERAGKKTGGAAETTGTAAPEGYFAGIRLVLQESRKWGFHTDVGVRLRIPPGAFVRLRARRTVPLGSWTLRLTQVVAYFALGGYSERTVLEFDRPVLEDLLFRSGSELAWRDREGRFVWSQSLNLFHKLGEDRGLAYRAAILGETEPSFRPTEYVANATYRQRIWRKWLFAEATPQLSYPRDNDFKHEASVTLRLEAMFGEEYLSPELAQDSP